ncbi:oxidoreductase FAD/NAD(P)-binding domain protein [human gut metagenome]|uniref:Oxidoreductase FAD/NAD(P)-binding domain protein n=1 Tax=human gut metagenome TaxID=408170 RepID=K1SK63_9ZZZZ
MYPIVKKEKLADKIYLMDVKAPRVAQYCEPGQFVIVKIDEQGERIPLTICDYNREAGTITIVFQTVGASTQRMVSLEQGDAFADFVGPLGCPSDLIDEDIEELKKKKIVFIAGGVGTAPVIADNAQGVVVQQSLLQAGLQGVGRRRLCIKAQRCAGSGYEN